MKHLYIYRVCNTGREDKECSAEYLARAIRPVVDANYVSAAESPVRENQYVLLRYEMDKAMTGEEAAKHFEKVTMTLGNLSDKIGFELEIEMMTTVAGTIVTPDSMIKRAAEGKDGDKSDDDDENDDEWAEVKRLRDIAKH